MNKLVRTICLTNEDILFLNSFFSIALHPKRIQYVQVPFSNNLLICFFFWEPLFLYKFLAPSGILQPIKTSKHNLRQF